MTKESYAVSHPEFMHIQRGGAAGMATGQAGGAQAPAAEAAALLGCDQDWYKIEWRRRAGCGPVAATNILLYLKGMHGVAEIPYRNDSVEDALEAMNDVFRFVRPMLHGLNTVKKFIDGMYKFGNNYGLSFWHRHVLVPPLKSKRPDLDTVTRFIKEGLGNDAPVAFLNLHSGDVEDQISSWHWVTVVEMTKSAEPRELPGGTVAAPVGKTAEAGVADKVTLRYYDQSKSYEVDLGKWLGSTKLGGGFVYFCRPSRRYGNGVPAGGKI